MSFAEVRHGLQLASFFLGGGGFPLSLAAESYEVSAQIGSGVVGAAFRDSGNLAPGSGSGDTDCPKSDRWILGQLNILRGSKYLLRRYLDRFFPQKPCSGGTWTLWDMSL